MNRFFVIVGMTDRFKGVLYSKAVAYKGSTAVFNNVCYYF